MRKKFFVQNISYSFFANFVSLAVSLFMTLIVPKFLSVEDFGLWQLFLFYFSFLGFFHFGWEDGIYLRYAGKHFKELNTRLFAGQFYFIFIVQVIIAFMVCTMCFIVDLEHSKKIALICAVALIPFVNFNNLCSFIMQITNRISDYAKILLTERVIYLLGVAYLLVFLDSHRFRDMYAAEVLAILGVSCVGGFLCRHLIMPHFPPVQEIMIESIENISVGIKLLIANVAGILIIGIIRYGISLGWDVSTFGKVALSLNISNFLMVFINSVSVVFFPWIKSLDEDKRVSVYMKIRDALTILLFGAMLGYYPIKFLLSLWLPKYADSFIYMSVLFPICLFEGKVSVLINTYLKSMRKEALMLKINMFSVLASIIVTLFSVTFFHNLTLAVFSIVFVCAFRCILAEHVIGNLLDVQLGGKIFEDIVMCTVFILVGCFFDGGLGMGLYCLAYAIYMFFHKKQAITMIRGFQ